MKKDTKSRIRVFLHGKIPSLTEEELNNIEKMAFPHDAVRSMAEIHKYSADPEALATSIDGMKEPTQVVKPLPYTAGNGRKAEVVMMVLITAVLLLSGLALFWANSADKSADDLKNDSMAIKKDIAMLQKDNKAAKDDVANLQLRAKLTEEDVLKLDKKVDGVVTATESLIGNANALTDKVAALNGEVAKKVDKTYLSHLATRGRVARVERRLDDYIAEAEEATPSADSPSPPTVYQSENSGTVTVIIPPEEE